MKRLHQTAAIASFALLAAFQVGCERKTTGFSPQMMADAVHQVLEADRTIYTQKVVTRLQNEEKVIIASEYWQDDKALPLPAQMFRMGAELVQEANPRFSYALLSLWPINKKNAPRTEAETTGMKAVAKNKDQNFYQEEKLGDKSFFTAVYADLAVAPACITCHNEHKDSPRSDFKLGDVMGAVIVRIQLN